MQDEVDTEAHDENSISNARLNLLWQIFVFQGKLIVDGLRDVVLVPVSLAAGLLGLIAGGDDPARFFRNTLRFGRKTEHWINLFGQRRGGGTADQLIAPLQNRVFDEVERNPWLKKANSQLNRTLDGVNENIARRQQPPASGAANKDIDPPH